MNVNPLWSAPPSSAPERSCHSLFLLLTNRRWVVSVPSGSEHREKIPREGEFTLRTDPWAGLIASTGSFYLMVPTSAVPRSKRIMYARASATSGEAPERLTVPSHDKGWATRDERRREWEGTSRHIPTVFLLTSLHSSRIVRRRRSRRLETETRPVPSRSSSSPPSSLRPVLSS